MFGVCAGWSRVRADRREIGQSHRSALLKRSPLGLGNTLQVACQAAIDGLFGGIRWLTR